MPIGLFKYSVFSVILFITACPSQEVDILKAGSITADEDLVSETNYGEGIAHCKAVFDNMLKTTGSASSTADCLIGYQLPSFSANTIGGKKITNESLKGKLTVINFWFTACRPCVAEIPGFNDIVDKYGKDKINYISIGRDSKSEVEGFLRKQPWKFDHIVDAESLIKGEFMFMWGFPTTMLVDESGKIIHAINRGKSGPSAPEHLKRRIVPHIDRALASK